jgi:hypothetical protein
MPLTAFQKEVARLLAAHRNPESHLAGGAVINREESSLRYSHDFDIFHDAAESVALSAAADQQALHAASCSVDWLLRQPGFYRAEVQRGQDQLRLDWTNDSAFRFFPVEPDPEFGYCLHRADLAINKLLALAGHTEFRDYLDILYLDGTYLSVAAIAWAACGKDTGYTPALLLDMANRHACFRDSDIKGEALARPVDLRELKKQWLAALRLAEALFSRLPAEELGCLYLDTDNRPVTPNPDDAAFGNLKRHWGSVRGAWPTIS